MNQCRTNKQRRSRGFTMMEVLVVVAIIAVISAIAIPSVISMRRNMAYRQQCDYAKTIFLAAQAHLTDLRSTGKLEQVSGNEVPVVLQTNDGAEGSTLPVEFVKRYVYTCSASGAEGVIPTDNPAYYYDAVLPVNSVESLLRDQQVIIEYNPRVGSVYAVFYAEEYAGLESDYAAGKLQRGEDWLKKNQVGYYNGSDLTAEELGFYEVVAGLSYENGQEGILYIDIPTQYTGNGVINLVKPEKNAEYIKAMEIGVTVIGESGGMFTKVVKESGAAMEKMEHISGGGEGGSDILRIAVALDSLAGDKGLMYCAENQKGIANNVIDYHVKPGDNVSIAVEINYVPNGSSDYLLLFDDSVIAGVNPLFHSLTDDGSSGYVLAVSNGRHLQKLNALDPSVAAKVSKVTFVSEEGGKTIPEIDWKDTVDHYNNTVLSYFAPINHNALMNRGNDKPFQIDGNGIRIRNLTIDYAKTSGVDLYYADPYTDANVCTGLFRFVNCPVSGLQIVNPIIRGATGNAENLATGALAGMAGNKAEISSCYVYVDTDEVGFENLNLNSFDGTVATQYGVSGYGTVGGMVGESVHAKFTGCFSAVPVYGNLQYAADGAGGFVGMANGGSFNECYTSVMTRGKHINCDGMINEEKDYRGLGGFVGYSNNATFNNCFASGNVTVTEGTLKACGGFVGIVEDNDNEQSYGLFNSCYALGTVAKGSTLQAKFVGFIDSEIKTGYLDRFRQIIEGTSGYLFENCYYLQGKKNVPNADNDTLPASFDMLYSIYNLAATPTYYGYISSSLGTVVTSSTITETVLQNAGFWPAHENWMQGLASKISNGHHPYMKGYKENEANYPYSMLTEMPFYGTWPDAPSDVGIAYWELYQDGTMGFYYDQLTENTLQDKIVVADGYALLSANNGTYEVKFNEGIEEKEKQNISLLLTTQIENTEYYYGFLPVDIPLSPDSFYSKVKLPDSNFSGSANTYTMYYNPYVAVSQISPAGNSISAQDPGSIVPDEIFIRSARQLSVLGTDAMSDFWDKNYVLYGQICYDQYGQSSLTSLIPESYREQLAAYGMVPQTFPSIGADDKPFTGNMIGSANSYIYVKKAESGLFNRIGDGALVANILLDGTMSLDGVEGGLVNVMNGGTVQACEVAAEITATETEKEKVGLVVGQLNKGLITSTSSTGANSSLAFLGDAARTSEAVDGDAKYETASLYKSDTVAADKIDDYFTAVSGEETKNAYGGTVDESCTYKLNGADKVVVTATPYYYTISGEDSYKMASESAYAFDQVSGLKLSQFTAGAEWQLTDYYCQLNNRYFPVYVRMEQTLGDAGAVVQETGETQESSEPTESTGATEPDSTETTAPPETEPPKTVYTYYFASSADGTNYISSKSTTDPSADIITDMTLYSLREAAAGNRYVLMDADGKLLQADGTAAEIPDAGIADTMIWTCGEENWTCGEKTITVTRSLPAMGYEQHPTVTVKTDPASETTAQYRVYAVGISNERDVTLVDWNPHYATTVEMPGT